MESNLANLTTIRDWIRYTATCMHQAEVCIGQGYGGIWDEAVALVMGAVYLPLDTDPRVIDASLTHEEIKRIGQMIKARTLDRMPTAYLLGEAWSGEIPFYVNEHVLIPRSPIAEWLAKLGQPWLSDQPERILDLCTGSGVLAVLAALNFPEASVDAVDLSPQALEIAERNRARYGLEDRMALFEGDLFKPVHDQQYDLIISNPPYVGAEEMAALPPEFLHEPRMALASGEDGLDCVRQILDQAINHLNPNGVLIVEVGYTAPEVEKAFPQWPFLWLDFEHGGEGVFLLTAEQLAAQKA